MRRDRLLLSLPLLLLAGCSRGAPPPQPPEPSPAAAEPAEPEVVMPEGPLRYRGDIEGPKGSVLEFFVELKPGDAGYAAWLTIPTQGTYGAALDEVSIADGRLMFALTRASLRWTAAVNSDGQVSDCTFEQTGVKLPCTMEALDEAAFTEASAPRRPQTPKPPFPYESIEQEYSNPADAVRLAGTLTVPQGPGPYPAALLITGSGPQDRDSTLSGHKPFAVLADHLTRQGIAVLRVDDRGMGGSTGVLSDTTEEALARDVAAGLNHLRTLERIDPARVGLIGHSEGGLIGPRVAAGDPKVAFVVMMAGPGVPGHEVIREQATVLLRAKGLPETAVTLARHQQAKVFEILREHPDNDKAREKLEAMLGNKNPQVDQVLTPWFRSFAFYDPAPALERLRCPVLVLNGELDTQVLPDQNLPVIEKALAKNRKRTTVHRLPGLNHLFQTAKTGTIDEYATIEETIAPQVLTIIGDWVVEQTAKPAKKQRKRTKKAKRTKP